MRCVAATTVHRRGREEKFVIRSNQETGRHCKEAGADEAIQRKVFWIATPLRGAMTKSWFCRINLVTSRLQSSWNSSRMRSTARVTVRLPDSSCAFSSGSCSTTR